MSETLVLSLPRGPHPNWAEGGAMSETLVLRRPGAGSARQVRIVRLRRRWLAGAGGEMRRVLRISETRLAAILATTSIWGEFAAALAAEMRRAA